MTLALTTAGAQSVLRTAAAGEAVAVTMGWLSVLLIILAVFFLPYVLQHLIVAYLFSPRDLKKTYNAQWALVTGSSSGEFTDKFCNPLDVIGLECHARSEHIFR